MEAMKEEETVMAETVEDVAEEGPEAAEPIVSATEEQI